MGLRGWVIRSHPILGCAPLLAKAAVGLSLHTSDCVRLDSTSGHSGVSTETSQVLHRVSLRRNQLIPPHLLFGCLPFPVVAAYTLPSLVRSI